MEGWALAGGVGVPRQHRRGSVTEYSLGLRIIVSPAAYWWQRFVAYTLLPCAYFLHIFGALRTRRGFTLPSFFIFQRFNLPLAALALAPPPSPRPRLRPQRPSSRHSSSLTFFLQRAASGTLPCAPAFGLRGRPSFSGGGTPPRGFDDVRRLRVCIHSRCDYSLTPPAFANSLLYSTAALSTARPSPLARCVALRCGLRPRRLRSGCGLNSHRLASPFNGGSRGDRRGPFVLPRPPL